MTSIEFESSVAVAKTKTLADVAECICAISVWGKWKLPLAVGPRPLLNTTVKAAEASPTSQTPIAMSVPTCLLCNPILFESRRAATLD